MDKEPFYASTRFWTAVLTPVIVALLGIAAEYAPAVKDLDSNTLTTIAASVVVMAVTYILARTKRNTRTSD